MRTQLRDPLNVSEYHSYMVQEGSKEYLSCAKQHTASVWEYSRTITYVTLHIVSWLRSVCRCNCHSIILIVHILSSRRVPHFRHLNKSSIFHSTTFKPSSLNFTIKIELHAKNIPCNKNASTPKSHHPSFPPPPPLTHSIIKKSHRPIICQFVLALAATACSSKCYYFPVDWT